MTAPTIEHTDWDVIAAHLMRLGDAASGASSALHSLWEIAWHLDEDLDLQLDLLEDTFKADGRSPGDPLWALLDRIRLAHHGRPVRP